MLQKFSKKRAQLIKNEENKIKSPESGEFLNLILGIGQIALILTRSELLNPLTISKVTCAGRAFMRRDTFHIPK